MMTPEYWAQSDCEINGKKSADRYETGTKNREAYEREYHIRLERKLQRMLDNRERLEVICG